MSCVSYNRVNDVKLGGFVKSEENSDDIHIKIEVHEVPEWCIKDEKYNQNTWQVMYVLSKIQYRL